MPYNKQPLDYWAFGLGQHFQDFWQLRFSLYGPPSRKINDMY